MITIDFRKMTASVKPSEWAYNFIVRNIIRRFASGRLSVQNVGSHYDVFSRYWHPKIPEAERNADPLIFVLEFIAIFASIPIDQCNELRKDSFEHLLNGILRLESAFKESSSLSTSEANNLTENLEKLLGRVVGHTVMAFSHNTHESRILYNQYKGLMTRHQQQGCGLVLKGLLPAKKVLQPESEYLQTVKELLKNVVDASSNLIDNVSKKYEKRMNDEHLMKLLIEDTDVESSDGSEVDSMSDDDIDNDFLARSSGEIEEVQTHHVNQNPTKRKLPTSAYASSRQGSKQAVNSNSSIHGIDQADIKLMPPPLFPTKSKHQHKIPATTKNRQNNNKHPELPVVFRKMDSDNENRSVVSSSTSYSTRTKHSFTPLQDAYIIFGMMKYRGKKQIWCEIYKKYPFPEYRTATHLKDRWRTLLKLGDVQIEGEKIVASQKYEAMFKHLYAKYEKDNQWEWKGKKKHDKRRLITLDEDEELDDVSANDSSDSDLPQEQPSKHNTIVEWLNNNTGISEKDDRPSIQSKETKSYDQPGTSGAFVKSVENGEFVHISDEEAPSDTGQVILQTSKSTEYIENVHGKFLPNCRNNTSTDAVHATVVESHTTDSMPRNSPLPGLSKVDSTDTSEQCLKPESSLKPLPQKDDMQITDHDPTDKVTPQDTDHEDGMKPDSQPINNDEIDEELESQSNRQDDNKARDDLPGDLSKEELTRVDDTCIIKSSPGIHKRRNTDDKHTNYGRDEQNYNGPVTHDLMKLAEQSLHCQLMREDDISFNSDTAVVKTTPVPTSANKNSISTICSDDPKRNDSENGKSSQKNPPSVSKTRNTQRNSLLHPLRCPTSPSTVANLSKICCVIVVHVFVLQQVPIGLYRPQPRQFM